MEHRRIRDRICLEISAFAVKGSLFSPFWSFSRPFQIRSSREKFVFASPRFGFVQFVSLRFPPSSALNCQAEVRPQPPADTPGKPPVLIRLVEVSAGYGDTLAVVVGLPDAAVKNSKDRVSTALSNSGYKSGNFCESNPQSSSGSVKNSGGNPVFWRPLLPSTFALRLAWPGTFVWLSEPGSRQSKDALWPLE